LRHQAIALLLSGHRREGIWDANVSGKAAEWIIGLEEQEYHFAAARRAGFVGDVIPEDMRVSREVIERDLDGRGVTVKCRQNIPGFPGMWKEMSIFVRL